MLTSHFLCIALMPQGESGIWEKSLMSATNGNTAVEQLTKCCPLKSVLQGSVAVASAEGFTSALFDVSFFCL